MRIVLRPKNIFVLTHLLHQRQQQVGEVEVSKVICPDLHLKPILGPGQGEYYLSSKSEASIQAL